MIAVVSGDGSFITKQITVFVLLPPPLRHELTFRSTAHKGETLPWLAPSV
jgi:hypothetical protein